MGDVNLVQLLLDREDTEPNHVEVNHCSALMIACMHGYVEVGFYHIKSYSMCERSRESGIIAENHHCGCVPKNVFKI